MQYEGGYDMMVIARFTKIKKRTFSFSGNTYYDTFTRNEVTPINEEPIEIFPGGKDMGFDTIIVMDDNGHYIEVYNDPRFFKKVEESMYDMFEDVV